MTLPAGIDTKIPTSPNAIRPSSAQNSVRAYDERPRRVAYPYAPAGRDEACAGARRLPQGGRVGLGVVGDDRRDGEPEQEAEPEQQSDGELLAALGGGDLVVVSNVLTV